MTAWRGIVHLPGGGILGVGGENSSQEAANAALAFTAAYYGGAPGPIAYPTGVISDADLMRVDAPDELGWLRGVS